MQNYASGNRTPWFSDNVSIDFIVPNSDEDNRIRPRVKQNTKGTIQPFDITVYQYNPNILDGKDLLEIFKNIVLFLNGDGYTDPFMDTNKQAIVKPRHSNIKSNSKGSFNPINECRKTISETKLTHIVEYCMREVVVDNKIVSLIKEYLLNLTPFTENVIRINENDFKKMIKHITKRILNEKISI